MKKIFLKNVAKKKENKKHKQINNLCILHFEYWVGMITPGILCNFILIVS